jgi:hypothetical protein
MTESIYNPNKRENAQMKSHHIQEYYKNGVYYQHGLGCSKFPDCFSCPFPDCVCDSSKLNKLGGE